MITLKLFICNFFMELQKNEEIITVLATIPNAIYYNAD